MTTLDLQRGDRGVVWRCGVRTTRVLAAIGLALPLMVTTSVPSAYGAEPTCDGRTATIVLPPVDQWAGDPDNVDPVLGTPGDDVIVGSEGRDVIYGGAGDDVICGLSGEDRLYGGLGNDRLFGGLDNYYVPDEEGYFGDLVVPGPGDDYVDLGADPRSRRPCICDPAHVWDRVSFVDAPGPVTVDLAAGTATGEGADTIVVPVPGLSAGIIGSAHDDVLLGSAAKDQISGGDGDDVVAGREDADWISLDGEVTAGDDRADGGEGNDSVRGLLGVDSVVGGEGHDHLSGGPGAVLRGGGGKDHLFGTSGTSLIGGPDFDQIELELQSLERARVDGGGDTDKLWLKLPKVVFGSGLHLKVDVPGTSVTIGRRRVLDLRRVEWFVLDAPAGRLTFLGGSSDETLLPRLALRVRAFGRGGRDALTGGGFSDLLDGGPGKDDLDGRTGRDRCLDGEKVARCEVTR